MGLNQSPLRCSGSGKEPQFVGASVPVPKRQDDEPSSPSRGHLGLELVLRRTIVPSSRDAREARKELAQKGSPGERPGSVSAPLGRFQVHAVPGVPGDQEQDTRPSSPCAEKCMMVSAITRARAPLANSPILVHHHDHRNYGTAHDPPRGRPMTGPEQEARRKIDAGLERAGWVVQDRDGVSLSAGRRVARGTHRAHSPTRRTNEREW
jgi:hypothetical protein